EHMRIGGATGGALHKLAVQGAALVHQPPAVFCVDPYHGDRVRGEMCAVAVFGEVQVVDQDLAGGPVDHQVADVGPPFLHGDDRAVGGDRVEVGAVAGVVVADLRVRADRAFPRIFGAPQLLAGGRVERGQAARSSPQFGPSAEHPVLPVGSESGGGAQFVVAVLGDHDSVGEGADPGPRPPVDQAVGVERRGPALGVGVEGAGGELPAVVAV